MTGESFEGARAGASLAMVTCRRWPYMPDEHITLDCSLTALECVSAVAACVL